jgi:hypothetical protein
MLFFRDADFLLPEEMLTIRSPLIRTFARCMGDARSGDTIVTFRIHRSCA